MKNILLTAFLILQAQNVVMATSTTKGDQEEEMQRRFYYSPNLSFVYEGESLGVATSSLQIKVELPSDSNIANTGKIFSSSALIYDSKIKEHDLGIIWTLTGNDQCTLSFLSEDALSILKNDEKGDPYGEATAMRVVFDRQGHPISFDDAPIPPKIYIKWRNTETAPSIIDLDLGRINTLQGIRMHEGNYIETSQSNNGLPKGNLIEKKGGIVYFDNGLDISVPLFNNIKMRDLVLKSS